MKKRQERNVQRGRGWFAQVRRGVFLTTASGVMLLIMTAVTLVHFLSACGKVEPQGILVIRSVPPGAEIFIDGEIVVGATTPAKLRLAPGTHLIKLRKANYEDLQKTVQILENKVSDFSLAMRETKGVVLVESDPPNAEVKSSGVKLGYTPLLLTELPLGTTILSLSHDGYDPSDISVTLSDRVPYVIKESLKSRLAPIYINSMPEKANVFLDGEFLGQTPVNRQYLAGTYRLRVELEGHDVVNDSIEIVARQAFSKTYQLKQSPVNLEITSNPPGASVFINGKNEGNAPLQLKGLPAGTYFIRLVLPKYLDAEKEVTIQPGKEASVQLNLQKNVGSIQVQTRPTGVEVRVDGRRVGTTKSDKGQETSDALIIPDIEAGERRIELIKEKFHVVTTTVTVKRDEIVLTTPPVIVMEQKDDTKLWLKGSTTPRLGVIVNRLPDGSIEFRSRAGDGYIKNTYPPNEIERVEPIPD